MSYKVIALVGEAGSGKDTLLQKIVEEYPEKCHKIINCTTRPIREGECDGVNYFYLTSIDFLDKVNNNEMLEYRQFNNWFYGTSYDSLSEDLPNIGVFNPASIDAISKREDIDLVVFKVYCDDKTRLLRQLNREERPNVDEIVRRYGTDKQDFNKLDFSYIVVSNTTENDLQIGADLIAESLDN